MRRRGVARSGGAFSSRLLVPVLVLLVVVPARQAAAARKSPAPASVQVAVVVDHGVPAPGEQSGSAPSQAAVAERQLRALAPSLRETVAEDLGEYARRGQDGREHTLFVVAEEPLLEQALLQPGQAPAGGATGAEQERLLRARLGLGGPAAEEGALFPGWVCDRLQEQQAQLGVLVYLQPRAVVVKLVLARPCLLIGRKAEESVTDHVRSVQNGLREVLDRSYRAYLQVAGASGLALVLDGETVGRLPLKEPVETVPGVHELRAQGDLLCDRVDKELMPGENLWAPNPCAAPQSSRLPLWIAAGATVGLGAAGVISHLDALSLTDEADSAKVRAGAIELRGQARDAALRTNVLYGAASAALVTTALLYLLDRPSTPTVAVSPAPQGAAVLVAGSF